MNLFKASLIFLIIYFSTNNLILPLLYRSIFRPPATNKNVQLYEKLNHFMIDDKISAVYLNHVDAKFTVLYSHGTGDDLLIIADYLDYVCDRFKVNIIAYDYSGYGLSKGSYNEYSLYEDIEIVFRYCTDTLQLNHQQIILWGQSLGTAVSIYLASNVPTIGGIIIQSGFYSGLSTRLPDSIVWFLQMIIIDFFGNTRNLSKLKTHCLIIHGINDMIIPFEHAENMLYILQNSSNCILLNYVWVQMGHGWGDFSFEKISRF
eukprot:UN05262